MLGEVNLKDLQHSWKEIEMLESMVKNLNKKLEIEKVAAKVNKLEKEQQIQIEELIEKNKDLFAEGLIQLKRTKEEMHKIVMKEGAKSIKHPNYQYPGIETVSTIKDLPQNAVLPLDLNQKQQKQFRKQAAHYCLQNSLLYRRNKRENKPPLKVIKENELEQVLYSLHTDIIAGHFGIESTYNKARNNTSRPHKKLHLLEVDLQLQNEEMPEKLLEQSLDLHIKKITEQLYQQRFQAQYNIQEAQQKQKEYYDYNLKSIKFKI
ncbi:7537_t:CDS:2, partial [Gigaspora margarita]